VATVDEIAAFRLLIAESADVMPYDDISLTTRLDAAESPQALAREIWLEKAAKFAQLVNVSESGSSRSLSDLHKNALAMAAGFGAATPDAPGGPISGVRMHRLTRS
jgi:hypothetical protein